ncbi:hypothetical protein [Streptomyces avermitilis]|uniref:hypothetical protein n=1 Tax=Streptomyces avermitilis TaxID=33903 RepID=UPI0038112EFD
MAARNIAPTGPAPLVGAIGRAALAGLLPAGHRWRLKARVRSKYTFTANKTHERPRRTPSTSR